MDNSFLFIFGLIAFLFAVGPLAVAVYLDWREQQRGGPHGQR